MDQNLTYLLINLFTISYPLAQSFEWRLKLYKKWFALLPAILITGIIFIIWDVIKTHYGVWWFNNDYLLGMYLINLPLEEWLFFITVPYACVFIYEVLNYYIKKDIFGKYYNSISYVLIALLTFTAAFNIDKAYTSVAFLSLAAYLLILVLFVRPKWLGKFYLAYIVSMIPFFIVNGILTNLPVVLYNNSENLSIRIFSIPIEDTMYSMLLFLMNVSIYEYFMARWKFIKEA